MQKDRHPHRNTCDVLSNVVGLAAVDTYSVIVGDCTDSHTDEVSCRLTEALSGVGSSQRRSQLGL